MKFRKWSPIQKFSWEKKEDVHQNLDRTVFTGKNIVASWTWIVILKIAAHQIVTKVWHCIFGNNDPINLILEDIFLNCYVEIQFTIKKLNKCNIKLQRVHIREQYKWNLNNVNSDSLRSFRYSRNKRYLGLTICYLFLRHV